jgi:hypothetical protein
MIAAKCSDCVKRMFPKRLTRIRDEQLITFAHNPALGRQASGKAWKGFGGPRVALASPSGAAENR